MDQSQLSRYKALDFFARQVVEGFITGKHKSPFHGFSVEFSDYRQYNTGESTRNIDWRLFGRTDRLYIKQFEEETNLRCQIIIDHSASMLFPLEGQGDIEHPNKLTFSVYAAAVLIELLHRQRDAFGLSLISDGIDSQTACRSNTSHQRHLLGILDNILTTSHKPEKGLFSSSPKLGEGDRPKGVGGMCTNLAPALHLTAEQLHRRSLAVIFTDAFDSNNQPDNQEALFDALRHLRHNHHEVILFHTFHRAHELQLDYDARPHRFVDLETGDTVKLNPAEIAATYRQQMEHQQAELQQRAMQYHVDYIPVDIAQGFHQIILPFLLKRSKQ